MCLASELFKEENGVSVENCACTGIDLVESETLGGEDLKKVAITRTTFSTKEKTPDEIMEAWNNTPHDGYTILCENVEGTTYACIYPVVHVDYKESTVCFDIVDSPVKIDEFIERHYMPFKKAIGKAVSLTITKHKDDCGNTTFATCCGIINNAAIDEINERKLRNGEKLIGEEARKDLLEATLQWSRERLRELFETADSKTFLPAFNLECISSNFCAAVFSGDTAADFPS